MIDFDENKHRISMIGACVAPTVPRVWRKAYTNNHHEGREMTPTIDEQSLET